MTRQNWDVCLLHGESGRPKLVPGAATPSKGVRRRGIAAGFVDRQPTGRGNERRGGPPLNDFEFQPKAVREEHRDHESENAPNPARLHS